MPLDDAHLIARVLADDDRHAFAELVRRHQSMVRSLLRRLTLGHDALADDLAQETVLRAYRGLRTYQGGARFSTWLYRVAYHVFVSDARRLRLEQAEADAGDLAPDPAAAASATGSDLRRDLRWALAGLSPDERAAITLAFGEDHTHAEVAAILDCPLGTVKTHIARGMVKMRERLRAYEQRGVA